MPTSVVDFFQGLYTHVINKGDIPSKGQAPLNPGPIISLSAQCFHVAAVILPPLKNLVRWLSNWSATRQMPYPGTVKS